MPNLDGEPTSTSSGDSESTPPSSGKRHWTSTIVTRGALIRILLLFLIGVPLLAYFACRMTRFPRPEKERSSESLAGGADVAANSAQEGLGAAVDASAQPATAVPNAEATAAELERHLRILCEDIGPRCTAFEKGLEKARTYIEKSFLDMGYEPELQTFTVANVPCSNVEVEIAGSDLANEILVVGGHYDTCLSTPGADDNATGAAATIELARQLRGIRPRRTLRFVCFVNEEPPFFKTPDMGSVRYAKRSKQRAENIVAMLSLEMLGYYSDEPDSQNYPPGFSMFYPSTGNFVGFVSKWSYRELVSEWLQTFRRNSDFPSEGASLPGFVVGVDLSDHHSFWEAGFPALMVTDTAFFRNDNYHTLNDTVDTIDFPRFAQVVVGLRATIAEMASR